MVVAKSLTYFFPTFYPKQLLFTYRMINYTAPTYPVRGALPEEDFPDFAQSIGWALLAVALAPVPLWFLYMLIKAYTNSSITTFNEVSLNFFFLN